MCNTVCIQRRECWAKTSTLPGSPPPKCIQRHTPGLKGGYIQRHTITAANDLRGDPCRPRLHGLDESAVNISTRFPSLPLVRSAKRGNRHTTDCLSVRLSITLCSNFNKQTYHDAVFTKRQSKHSSIKQCKETEEIRRVFI